MILNTTCHNCRRPFEYEDTQIGEMIDCPDCGHKTLLDSGKKPATPVPPALAALNNSSNRGLKILFLSLGGALLLAVACVAIWYGTASHEDVAGGILGGAMGIVVIIGAVLGFVVALFWTIFPFMVHSLLNRILLELQKIEHNTRTNNSTNFLNQ